MRTIYFFRLFFLSSFILGLNGMPSAPPPSGGGTPTVSPSSPPPPPPVPVLPSPVTESSSTTTTTASPSTPSGPETVKLPAGQVGINGNWVKKREWLKETLNVNDQIQDMVVDIQKSRKIYDDKYSAIEQELDAFYKQEGLLQGETQALFSSLHRFVDKKRKKEKKRLKKEEEDGITGEYEIKLDIMDNEIKAQERDLEQFKLDMKSIQDLDKSINARLAKLEEQIKIAVTDASKAAKQSEEIWLVIDDKKARAIYYELKGNILPKVTSIQTYIKGPLLSNFDTVLQTSRSKIAQVKSGIHALEDKGFIVKDRVDRLKEIKLQKLDRLKAEHQASLDKEAKQEIKKEEKKDLSWTDKVYNFVVDLVAKITVFFNGLLGD